MKQIDIAKLRLKNQQLISAQYSSPEDVVRWMGAMQAQDFTMSQWAIGIRMKKPSQKMIYDSYNQGRLIRTHLQRATWQVVAKEDIRWMINLFGARAIKSWAGFAASIGAPLTDKLMDDSRNLLREILAGGHWMTREEIIPLYDNIHVKDTHQARHLLTVAEAEGVVCNGPIEGRGVTYTLMDDWVPRTGVELSYDESLKEMAMRYFQSHSPATLADYSWWSGLTIKECRAGIEQLGDYLTVIEQDGISYYLPSQAEPVRMPKELVHLIPPYDEILLGYKNREAVLPKIYERMAHNNYGIFHPIILMNRDIVGNWTRKDLQCDFFHEVVPSEAGVEEAKNVYRKYCK